MSRLIYANLVPDDVILADQAYGNYVDLVLVKQQGADAVFRKNHLRKTDLRAGEKVGNWRSQSHLESAPTVSQPHDF